MAIYPCQICDQRVQGEARNAYLTLYRGEARASFRFMGHMECIEALADGWAKRGFHKTDDEDWSFGTPESTVEDCWVIAGDGRNGHTVLPWDAQGVRKKK